MKLKSKRKFICALLIFLTALVACTAEGEDLDLIDEQNSKRVEEQGTRPEIYQPHESLGVSEEQEIDEDIEPTFLDLEYMYSFEVDYFSRASLTEGEFTLFETIGSGGDRTFEEANDIIENLHRFKLPEYVDLDENSFVTISMGRRLQIVYYYEIYRRDLTFNHIISIARPVFEREYYPNTVFVYRASPLPRYRFNDQEMFTNDFAQFNNHNNIPFEVWPYDESMERGGSSIQGDQIIGSTLGEGWQEFTEPLEGYIHVEETYLRSLPTEHSSVLSRLDYGVEFTINGYVEGGMEIDGSGRWYYVWTPMGAGNKPGYIHSSLVTITSEIDDD